MSEVIQKARVIKLRSKKARKQRTQGHRQGQELVCGMTSAPKREVSNKVT